MTTITTSMGITDVLADSSGKTSTRPDFIRQIASQEPWRATSNTVSSTGPSTLNPESQAATTVALNRSASVALFPDEPRARSVEASFYALQEWEGYVIDISEDTFTARLMDLSATDGLEEEADFPIADLSSVDQSELRLGAIFRWSIGYRKTCGGSKERVSRIVFRRLPAWTEAELERSHQQAEALAVALQGE